MAFFGYMNLQSLSLPTFNYNSTRGAAPLCIIMDWNVALWLDCSFYKGMAGAAAAAPEAMYWLLLL